jgi:branched-chain amino acid transport system permease protein
MTDQARRPVGLLIWPILLAALALLPLVYQMTDYANYLTYITSQIMILGLLAMSYDLLFGYTGMLSMGQALLSGGAAYVVAILSVRVGLKFTDATLLILAAMAVGVILGWIQGFLSCRLGPMAVFLVTFSTAESLYLVILADPLGLTNSENGISGIARHTFLGLFNIKPEVNFFYLVLILLVLSFLALKFITRLPFGDTLQAIRENPERASYLGYDIRQYRIMVFVISGLFASLSGSLTALHQGGAAPEMLTVMESANPLLYTILGGPGTLIGPLLGTAVMVVFMEVVSDYISYHMLVVAGSIVLLIFFLPGGFYSLLQKLRPAKAGSAG